MLQRSSTCESQRRREGGFSMVEVLVTLLIIALALLGTAGLQAYSMRLSQSSVLRSQAVFLVADLSERMEANRERAKQRSGGNTAEKDRARQEREMQRRIAAGQLGAEPLVIEVAERRAADAPYR